MPVLADMKPALKDLLNVATEAAYLGGRRALAYFNTGVKVETKQDRTPVTCADREAEAVIRDRILRSFPDHSILGEEGGTRDGNPDYKWIVDPIDGTKSFVCGVPLWGVLIGLEIRGRVEVGAAYLPALDEMLVAASGLGCTWNGRQARVSTVNRLEDAVLVTTSPRWVSQRSDAFARLESRAKVSAAWGDCYGYVLVATGRAEIMLDPKMNIWDCGALLPILREAGGYFTSWAGEPTIYGNDAVATNAELHEQVMAVLKSERRTAAE